MKGNYNTQKRINNPKPNGTSVTDSSISAFVIVFSILYTLCITFMDTMICNRWNLKRRIKNCKM